MSRRPSPHDPPLTFIMSGYPSSWVTGPHAELLDRVLQGKGASRKDLQDFLFAKGYKGTDGKLHTNEKGKGKGHDGRSSSNDGRGTSSDGRGRSRSRSRGTSSDGRGSSNDGRHTATGKGTSNFDPPFTFMMSGRPSPGLWVTGPLAELLHRVCHDSASRKDLQDFFFAKGYKGRDGKLHTTEKGEGKGHDGRGSSSNDGRDAATGKGSRNTGSPAGCGNAGPGDGDAGHGNTGDGNAGPGEVDMSQFDTFFDCETDEFDCERGY